MKCLLERLQRRRDRIGIPKEKKDFMRLEKVCADYLDMFLYSVSKYIDIFVYNSPERIREKFEIDRKAACREYDLYLKRSDCHISIEEKSASYYHPDMPFEEMQCVTSHDIGWIYTTKAAMIVYTYWPCWPESRRLPFIYIIDNWGKCFEWFQNNRDSFEGYEALGGWGLTQGRRVAGFRGRR